jgi:hypothetical protein
MTPLRHLPFAFAALFGLAASADPAAAFGCGHHGACATPAHVPAPVFTHTQRIETSPGYVTREVVPAQYATVSKQVMVRPASVRYETVPAQYRTVQREVVVQPACWREETVASHGGGHGSGHGGGHHGLLGHGHMLGRGHTRQVYVPAVTRTVTEQVLVSPARTIAHTTPAQYETVTQRLLVSPERTRVGYVPATYHYVSTPIVYHQAYSHARPHHPTFEQADYKVREYRAPAALEPVPQRQPRYEPAPRPAAVPYK